jgi:hypothetical protein
MRACLTALVALLVCAASGCANFNFLKRKSVSPAGAPPAVGLGAGPAGVSPYDPGVGAAAPYYAPPVAYGPAGGYGGYGGNGGYGGFARHVKHRPNPYGNEGGAAVGYPYYTTRGPRDFLLANTPSIGR